VHPLHKFEAVELKTGKRVLPILLGKAVITIKKQVRFEEETSRFSQGTSDPHNATSFQPSQQVEERLMSPSPTRASEHGSRSNKSQKSDKSELQVINNHFFGSVLDGRYLIGRLIDRGSFGQIYKVVDLHDR
jgi:hypothetical protein